MLNRATGALRLSYADLAVTSDHSACHVRPVRMIESGGGRAFWHKPEWEKGRDKPLTTASHQRFRAINLHRHDLRHEYASRLVERGVPLSQVRDLRGHASIVTTERYDNHTFAALQQAARRLESGKTFTSASQSEPNPKSEGTDSPASSGDNALDGKELETGGPPGDRTRDTVIKSHVLYH